MVLGDGCEEIDVNKLERTWSEQYDPTLFAMDGNATSRCRIINLLIINESHGCDRNVVQ